MTKTTKLTLAVLPLLLTLACTDANKAPAEAAVKAAETAAAALTEEIGKLAPDEAKAVREGLANAKVAIAKQDFKTARSLAEPLAAKATAAIAAANARKEALAKEAAARATEAKQAFDAGAAALGKKLEGMKKKVTALAKAKKLPKGVTKADVAKGKETVAALEADFLRAKAQLSTDAAAALATAKDVEAKAVELAKALKLK
jgi:histone H1/5